MERVPAAAARIVPMAGALVRVVRLASLLALASAALVAVALFAGGVPEPQARAILSAALAAAAFVPGAILFVLHRTLLQLVELPARLRALPGRGREQADELARLARERPRLPLRAWRLIALGRSSRELLTPYAPLAPLLSPPFLLAAGISLVLTPLLVLLGLAALVSLA